MFFLFIKHFALLHQTKLTIIGADRQFCYHPFLICAIYLHIPPYPPPRFVFGIFYG